MKVSLSFVEQAISSNCDSSSCLLIKDKISSRLKIGPEVISITFLGFAILELPQTKV